MYPSPARPPSLSLSPQSYAPAPPQYPDFASYHHVPGIPGDPQHSQPAGAWGSPYAPSKDDWHSYGPSAASPAQLGFGPPDFNPLQPPGSGLLPPPMPQLSPGSQRRTPFEWMRRSTPSGSSGGKAPPAPHSLPAGHPRAGGAGLGWVFFGWHSQVSAEATQRPGLYQPGCLSSPDLPGAIIAAPFGRGQGARRGRSWVQGQGRGGVPRTGVSHPLGLFGGFEALGKGDPSLPTEPGAVPAGASCSAEAGLPGAGACQAGQRWARRGRDARAEGEVGKAGVQGWGGGPGLGEAPAWSCGVLAPAELLTSAGGWESGNISAGQAASSKAGRPPR